MADGDQLGTTILDGVSRETGQRLQDFVALLLHWQRRVNLISPDSIGDIWSRHVRDSLQLVALKPLAARWLDLGSGGGLPGLVIACHLAQTPGAEVHLVESNQKKAAFLRHVASELSLPAIVHARRIEDVIAGIARVEIISARALAPLPVLLSYTNLLLKSGVVGLFPKGRDHQRELTEAREHWHFDSVLHASVTDPEARIIEVTMAEHKFPA